MTIADLRKEYTQSGLTEAELDADPFRQFDRWFREAAAAGVDEPNAMTLATADAAGRPSARIVLLKHYDPRGFVFFTNYDSRKGGELEANPHAALVFFWPSLERQIRIVGSVEKTSAAESDEYFHQRPLDSQLGAWSSRQSSTLVGRAELESSWAAAKERYAGGVVPLPPFWGGYRLAPTELEFWQGRPSRLHDRLRYARRDDGGWSIDRLSP
ncbi:MAG: pyridoxamine 5'-phosphate oxidase [Planctomycetia bacterium]